MKSLLSQKGFLKLTKKTITTYIIVSTLFFGTGLVYLFGPWTKKTEAVWFNDDWGYRKLVQVTAHTDAETNVYQTLTVATDALVTAGKLQSDCDDLRFTKVNGEILPYQIVSGCNSATTSIRVGFNTMPAAPFDFYMYYGNPSVSAGSTTLTHAACSNSCATISSFGSEVNALPPTAYYKLDEGQGTTTKNSSSNSNNGTVTSATWKTEDMCISGKCLAFDGSSSVVTSPDAANLDITGAITIETWVYWVGDNAGGASGATSLVDKTETGDAANYRLYIKNSGNSPAGSFGFYNGSEIVDSNTAVTTNTWHHLAVTISGVDLNLYIDGKFDKNGSKGLGSVNNGLLRIGSDINANRNLKGRMDEVKIYNYVRSAAQILADYNSRSNPEGVASALGANTQNMPGALSNGLVGYWKMDDSGIDAEGESSTDSSGNVNTGTLFGDNGVGDNGTGMDCTAVGKYSSGCNFDGTDDYVQVTNNTVLNPSTFTVSFWLNKVTEPSDFDFIVGKRNASGQNSGWSTVFDDSGSNRKVYFAVYNTSGAQTNTYTQGNSLSTGVWRHYTFTFDGTTLKGYEDGVQVSTNTISGTFQTSSDDLYFASYVGTSLFPNIKIDETRIYNRALTSAEVTQLYNFAPGPVGYWKMEEKSGTSALDSSSNGKTLTLSSASWNTGKFGSGWDGTGSVWLSRTDDDNLDFVAADNFSIGVWFKSDSATNPSNNEYLLTKGTITNTGTAGYAIYADSTGKINFGIKDDGAWGASSPDTITPDDTAQSANDIYDATWHYIQAVKTGATKIELFVDGVLSGSDTTIAATGSLANAITSYFGDDDGDSANSLNGNLDEVKIYNYARTAGQIVEDMNAGHPAPGSPLGSAIAYWKFDQGADNMCSGGTNDACNSGSLGNAVDGAITGATWTQAGKFGKALSFSDDYVSTSGESNFDFTSDFTISTWINVDSTNNTAYRGVLGKYNGVSTNGWDLGVQSNNIRMTARGTSNIDTNTGGSTLATETWYHLVVVTTNSNIKIYLNGVLDRTVSGTWTSTTNDTAVTLGNRDANTNTTGFIGELDEVKIYNFALTADQVKLDMNRGSSQVMGALSDKSTYEKQAANQEYCVPGDSTSCAGPTHRYDFEEGSGSNLYDTSINGRNGTWNGTISPRYVTGKKGKAGNFANATSDFVQVSGATLPTGDFTYEAWVYPTSNDASGNAIFMSQIAGGAGNELLIWEDTLSRVEVQLNGTSRAVTSATLSLNTWTHVAATRSGGTVLVYLNGIKADLSLSSSYATALSLDTCGFGIGLDWDGSACTSTGNFFDGRIDDVKIYNYARSAAQIAWDYNKGGPFGYWKFDECQGLTANDSTGNSNTGTITITTNAAGTCNSSGTDAWFNGVAGKRNYSLKLDGNDYIDVGDLASSESKSQLSWAFWVKPGTLSTDDCIFCKFNGSAATQRSWGVSTGSSDSSKVRAYVFTNLTDDLTTNFAESPTGMLVNGTWSHVVVVYDGTLAEGNRLKFYVNAIPQTASITGTITTASLASTSNARIGATSDASSGNFLNGQIDDVKIYNYPLTAVQALSLYNDGIYRVGPVTGAP